jgi:hypothetical protein
MATKKIPSIPTTTKAPTTKKAKAEITLVGHEAQVARLVEAKEYADFGTAQMEAERPALEHAAAELRASMETDGVFHKTVTLKGNAKDCTLTFTDSYSKIDVSVEGDLMRLLGEHYGSLFVRCKTVSVKDATKMMDLIEYAKKHAMSTASGKEFTKELEDQISVDEFIKPVPEFRAKRFELRCKLSKEQNDALDFVVKQVSARPSLRVG